MKYLAKILKAIALCVIMLSVSCSQSTQVHFKTNLSKQGKEISTDLIGVFFEDINYAADGGIYAELIQNRSFEYYKVPRFVDLEPLHAWSLVKGSGAEASMAIENAKPINKNNLNYLKLDVEKSGLAGVKNAGFDGISVKKDEKYKFSIYLKRGSGFKGDVILELQNEDNKTIGKSTIKNITTDWQKYSGEISCDSTTKSANFNILVEGEGGICIDMVSLFPENTFMDRENGLRPDIAEAIADLEPKFVRFPGGCISHGRGLDNAYRWKETVGDVAERKANFNLWGYHQTYGLGFFEYFQYAEDIGAMPLPVVPVGISCQFRDREIAPMDEMQIWVDDALDLVEFANGDVNTEWGSVRAEMGHPEPFNMEYICLGNEEDYIPEFVERFNLIADALNERYPEIKVIGTSGTAANGFHYDKLWEFSKEEEVDAVDEHYYVSPSWLLANNERYDSYDRNGPKVFIGEYASRGDMHENAIAEAAYLTGVERNADIIEFTCYAPLLRNENHYQWNPDLIHFDNDHISKTVSYYVQQMYGKYFGDEYLSSSVSFVENFDPYQDIFQGRIGVGSWNTKVEFESIEVVSGDNQIVSESIASTPENWEVIQGTFSFDDGVYKQSSLEQPALSILNTPITESNYTINVKAKKTEGVEGFLIPFAFKNQKDYYWLNIGGWNNTQHGLEITDAKGKSTIFSVRGSIESNVWYNVKIEVTGSTAKVYLNDELLFDVPPPTDPVVASVVKNSETNELIIKMVNSSNKPFDILMDIEGETINQQARVITLSGNPEQRNSLDAPETVVPVEETFPMKNKFTYNLAANTFKVFVVNLNE